jgi:class 3 adenylate cyclase
MVIDNIREAVVLVSRTMIVQDCNRAALRLFDTEKPALIGRALSDILVAPAGHLGIGNVLAKIVDTVAGVDCPLLTEEAPRIVVQGKTKIVVINVQYLTENGARRAQDPATHIIAVLLQLSDLTEQKLREEVLERDVSHVRSMLERVIPASVVKQLADGQESLAFAVQSASVGWVRLSIPALELNTNDPFGGIHKVYDLFNAWMDSFSQLVRVSVFAYEYVFAGGVFTQTNKPEKHAEEATRFALKILESIAEIRAALGNQVTLFIGLATGGPLIGGVMNARRAMFDLIGNPVDLAKELAATAIEGQLQVTRSVYELVYIHNFTVIERGDVRLSSGKVAHTYLITP